MFNNINKTICLSVYWNSKQKKNISFSEKSLSKITEKISKEINAEIIKSSYHSFDENGKSCLTILSDSTFSSYDTHLNTSHISIHTYYEKHLEKVLWRLDLDLSTCGSITPLKCN